MFNLTEKNRHEILLELLQEGYTEEEADKIIQGYKEMQEGKGISAEDVYKSLLSKEKVYA